MEYPIEDNEIPDAWFRTSGDTIKLQGEGFAAMVSRYQGSGSAGRYYWDIERWASEQECNATLSGISETLADAVSKVAVHRAILFHEFKQAVVWKLKDRLATELTAVNQLVERLRSLGEMPDEQYEAAYRAGYLKGTKDEQKAMLDLMVSRTEAA